MNRFLSAWLLRVFALVGLVSFMPGDAYTQAWAGSGAGSPRTVGRIPPPLVPPYFKMKNEVSRGGRQGFDVSHVFYTVIVQSAFATLVGEEKGAWDSYLQSIRVWVSQNKNILQNWAARSLVEDIEKYQQHSSAENYRQILNRYNELIRESGDPRQKDMMVEVNVYNADLEDPALARKAYGDLIKKYASLLHPERSKATLSHLGDLEKACTSGEPAADLYRRYSSLSEVYSQEIGGAETAQQEMVHALQQVSPVTHAVQMTSHGAACPIEKLTEVQKLVYVLSGHDENTLIGAIGSITPEQLADSGVRKALLDKIGKEQLNQDSGALVRKAVVAKLSEKEIASEDIALALVGAIDAKNGELRRAVRAAIPKISFNPAVKNRLLGMLQGVGKSPQVTQEEVIAALGLIKPKDPESHQALAQALSDHSNLNARARAAWALGMIKPTDKIVRGALVMALQDQMPNVRIEASKALKKIFPTEVALGSDTQTRLDDDAVRSLKIRLGIEPGAPVSLPETSHSARKSPAIKLKEFNQLFGVGDAALTRLLEAQDSTQISDDTWRFPSDHKPVGGIVKLGSATQQDEFRVMSMNVLNQAALSHYGLPQAQGLDRGLLGNLKADEGARDAAVFRVVRNALESGTGVICLQEVSLDLFSKMQTALADDFGLIYHPNFNLNSRAGNGVIIFDKRIFQKGEYTLDPQQGYAGQNYIQKVRLTSQKGNVVTVINTHTPQGGGHSYPRQLRLLPLR